MRTNRLTCISAVVLLAALAVLAGSNAQELKTQNKPHTRYKLFDIGTLGGPFSYPAVGSFINGASAQSLSANGTFTGQAESSIPDPFDPYCFTGDCLVSHAVQWKEGRLTDLEALPGPAGLSALSTWISGNGLIVGLAQNGVIDPFTGAPAVRSVMWVDGKIIDLGVLNGGYEGVASAVNNRGEVVGLANNAIADPDSLAGFGSETRAVVWRNGTIHDLGTLGGSDAVALLVNEHGQIVGESYTADSIPPPTPSCGDHSLTMHGFFWENGKMVDMNTLGGNCTFALALNNRAQVVGQSTLAGDQRSHPYLWERGQMKDLGALGGDYGYATWVNEAGEVVGGATTKGDQALLSFLWKHGAMSNLGTLKGDSCSAADAINSKGQTVGGSGIFAAPFFPMCTDTFEHAVLWEDGRIYDLNLLVTNPSDMTLNEATFINDRGEISGFGTLTNGDTHAFVLIPCGQD